MLDEKNVPEIKLQSMVYQLMRLCEKLEAGGDRGIQRDIELRETVADLNATIAELNQIGPLLQKIIKETTQTVATKVYNDLLDRIEKSIDRKMVEICNRLANECNRVEKVVNDNEGLVLRNFLLYIIGAILAGCLIGVFITLKFFT